MFSITSVCPEFMSPQKLNPVEPPWYGPVCPVVWEGWRREASPYPDLRPATEQPKKSCRANSESKRKNRPKEAPKPRLLRQSALSAFELLESGSREPRG